MDFYKQSVNFVIEHFKSNAKEGLRDKDVAENRQKWGNNILKESNKRSIWLMLLSQFR
jgi:magnesium-transporting ATPase (P-type)